MKDKNTLISIVIATGMLVITLIQIWLPLEIFKNSDNQESEKILGAKQIGYTIAFFINVMATLITPFMWATIYISVRYLIFQDREMRNIHIILLIISSVLALILLPFIFRWPY